MSYYNEISVYVFNSLLRESQTMSDFKSSQTPFPASAMENYVIVFLFRGFHPKLLLKLLWWELQWLLKLSHWEIHKNWKWVCILKQETLILHISSDLQGMLTESGIRPAWNSSGFLTSKSCTLWLASIALSSSYVTTDTEDVKKSIKVSWYRVDVLIIAS